MLNWKIINFPLSYKDTA